MDRKLCRRSGQPTWIVRPGPVSARVADRQTRVARTVLEQVTPGFTVWTPGPGGGPSSTCGMFQPGISLYLGSQLYY
jgi:hypothetical protein